MPTPRGPFAAAVVRRIRQALARWYAQAQRSLPWRGSEDPYQIWVSEVMLQQTRVAAVLPYYERFLARFPNVQALAAAPEAEVLALWSGLGYYSRARNLQRAAREIAAAGGFPQTYDAIRALPGVGEYTAAAVASIAFQLPHAVVDGNVRRVLARLLCEEGEVRSAAVAASLQQAAAQILDPAHPGDSNQALMELGATICVPRNPQCLLCPVAACCEGRARGIQSTLPRSTGSSQSVDIFQTLLVVQSRERTLFWQRGPEHQRMAGFWELPAEEQLPAAEPVRELGRLRHTITRHNYQVRVVEARLRRSPAGFRWLGEAERASLPLSTLARKALRLLPS